MKKSENTSKTATISSSERSKNFNGSVDSSCDKKNGKGSSMILKRKAKSSQDLITSRSKSSTSSSSKLSLQRKSSLGNSFPNYNADELSPTQMQESLIRLRKNAVQPFTFLSNILDEKTSNDHVPIAGNKPTEIDLQLAALTRRVQLNKSLLERTNERVKEINFLVERNEIAASRDLNYDDPTKASDRDVPDIESALNIACPGITELKKTINTTKEMLGYVKKVCNNELRMKDLPHELSEHTN